MKPSTQRLPRLYIEQDLGGGSLTLDEPGAHYLGHVLRLERGDNLVVFNGRGIERYASIESVHRRGAELRLTGEREPLAEPSLELTLLQALPKSDAMDLIVQKATELGVRRLIPVYTEFSVVKLDGARSEKRAEHWRKIARSACEQSGRHRPPQILEAASLAEALEALAPDALRLALDPSADAMFDAQPRPPYGVIVAVGPEGGFSLLDWHRLDAAGFVRIALGPRVLRAETAALAISAIAQARWGDLDG